MIISLLVALFAFSHVYAGPPLPSEGPREPKPPKPIVFVEIGGFVK